MQEFLKRRLSVVQLEVYCLVR